MVSEKPWQFDAVLMLGLGLIVSLMAGMLVGALLLRFLPDLNEGDKQFFGFVIGGICFHGAALVLAHHFLRRHEMAWTAFLGLGSPALGKTLLRALLVGVAVVPLALTLNALSQWLIESLQMKAVGQPSMRILEVTVSPGRRVCFGVTAIVVAPVVEEILFRGLLYPFLKQAPYTPVAIWLRVALRPLLRWLHLPRAAEATRRCANWILKRKRFPRLALWSTALLFAAIHANLMTLVPLTVFALVLTWLYEKTDALVAPILAHSFFNATNFFLFIYREPLIEWGSRLLDWWRHLRPAA